MLIIFGGLPGSGKTTIARELAIRIGSMYLRIDSIEQAIESSDGFAGPMNDAGYRVAYSVALDNLRLGRTVIADSVNPLNVTRDAWLEVANRAAAKAIEIEVACSDAREHRLRVETRQSDIPRHTLPSWQEVISRVYDPWNRDHVVVDTAGRGVESVVEQLQGILREIDSTAPVINRIQRRTV